MRFAPRSEATEMAGGTHTMNDGSISTDLYQFFAAYFHQDWDLEADDWEGIVDNYVNEDPIAEPLRALAQEIDDLREARPEPDLKQFLVRTVGVDYLPGPLTYKEWLGQIADRLRQQAAAIENGSVFDR
jgi:hypothetical protein